MSNIQCRSCGAIFDDHLTACPHCGATCIKGSENAFLRYLRKLTGRVADAPAENEREGLKVWKHMAVLVITTMLIVMLAAAALFTYSNMEEQARCRQIKETILHEQ